MSRSPKPAHKHNALAAESESGAGVGRSEVVGHNAENQSTSLL